MSYFVVAAVAFGLGFVVCPFCLIADAIEFSRRKRQP